MPIEGEKLSIIEADLQRGGHPYARVVGYPAFVDPYRCVDLIVGVKDILSFEFDESGYRKDMKAFEALTALKPRKDVKTFKHLNYGGLSTGYLLFEEVLGRTEGFLSLRTTNEQLA